MEMETEMVYGRQAVRELIKSGKPLNKVLFQAEAKAERNGDIVAILRERGIPAQIV